MINFQHMIKFPISLLCVVAGFISAGAQQNVAVKYNASNRDTDSGNILTKEMILVANPTRSFYYNKMSLYVDSCMSTPEGAAKLREVQDKAMRVEHPDGTVTWDGWKYGRVAPKKEVDLYVTKDVDHNLMTVYDRKAGESRSYDESLSEISWEIVGDSTKTILGYDCIMAESDYHGRKWKAWFTMDIPVQDGPWKLHGLPGIILEADGGDDFSIVATEVGGTFQDVPTVYSLSGYQKGDRKKILSEHEHYINNLESILAAQGIKINGDGSPANLPKYDRRRQAWETDYK